MNIRIISTIVFLVSPAILQATPYYLKDNFSITSEHGIHGFAVNTVVDYENGVARVDGKIVDIPFGLLSDKPVQVREIKKIVKQENYKPDLEKLERDAKAMEEAAARINAQAAAKPYVSPLSGGKATSSGSLGAANYGTRKGGFYLNPDGSLGKRVGN